MVMVEAATIITERAELLARLRLLQLVSPSLPVGAFTYSQGLEWAVETGWVNDLESLARWLESLLETGVARVDLPLLARLYRGFEAGDAQGVEHWGRWLLACRETAELRAEERNRARALRVLLGSLEVQGAEDMADSLDLCQAAGFALACVRWGIALEDAALGYAWGWLESQVTAAIKLVPLGQTDGQRVLYRLAGILPAALELGLGLEDGEIGASSQALAIASSHHETQYTRLFRS